MATKGIRELFGDALFDSNLRARLVKDPEVTAKIEGYEINEDEKEVLKQLTAEDWKNLSIEELDSRIALCGGDGGGGDDGGGGAAAMVDPPAVPP